MAARYWKETDAWVVTQTTGVEINPDDSTTVDADVSLRPIALPSSWSELVTDLKQARGSDCGAKAEEGESSDAHFDEYTLHSGKENLDRECSGYMPPDPVEEDTGTDPREHTE